MGLWEWIDEFQEKAADAGDRRRFELGNVLSRAYPYRERNPEMMLALFDEGRRAAEELHEPWWVMFFDHWRLQTLLHHVSDYRNVLEIAVPAALEVRKPAYAQLPQRLCIYEDLITAYEGIDPDGYADRIEQALEYMQNEVTEDVQCRYCLQGLRTTFALDQERLADAEATSLRRLEMAAAAPGKDGAEHHSISAYSDLCEVAFRAGRWDDLARWSAAGEEVARKRDSEKYLVTFLAWQALLARREGREDQARSLRRALLTRVARIKAAMPAPYYDALCAYYEAGGESDKALEARDRQLQTVAGKGMFHYEARICLKRCELLARMGRPLEEQLALAREAAGRLKKPEKYLAQLERVSREAGKGGGS
ncbi:MAG TPA: hypothetical protein VFA26_09075 [Gemmataceae bacterium]|nr:hypothetical protein [Gemmataceae bacterium]